MTFIDGTNTEFPVYQLHAPASTGATLPFSPEVARKIYECMVRSHVYDGLLLQLQRQGRISFYWWVAFARPHMNYCA